MIVTCNKDGRLPCVPTSPNMPTRETALVYPGMCLIEGTTVSEGRGTTSPFLQIGAPGVDPLALVDQLRQAATARASTSCPCASGRRSASMRAGSAAGSTCAGSTRRRCRACASGSTCSTRSRRSRPTCGRGAADAYEFVTDKPAIDLLWGSGELRECIDQGGDLDALLEKADAQAQAFRA